MAFGVTSVRILGDNMRCFDVTALDADLDSGNIAHHLPFTPTFVSISQVGGPATAYPAWAIATDATNFQLTKQAGAGGSTAGTLRVLIGRIPNAQNLR